MPDDHFQCKQFLIKQAYSRTGHHRFDLIVSNPPFFSHAQKPQSLPKELCRHDTWLSLKELAGGVG